MIDTFDYIEELRRSAIRCERYATTDNIRVTCELTPNGITYTGTGKVGRRNVTVEKTLNWIAIRHAFHFRSVLRNTEEGVVYQINHERTINGKGRRKA